VLIEIFFVLGLSLEVVGWGKGKERRKREGGGGREKEEGEEEGRMERGRGRERGGKERRRRHFTGVTCRGISDLPFSGCWRKRVEGEEEARKRKKKNLTHKRSGWVSNSSLLIQARKKIATNNVTIITITGFWATNFPHHLRAFRKTPNFSKSSPGRGSRLGPMSIPVDR
jgi:hypothetical protein